MNSSRLVLNSLLHYWRTNFAVLLGVIAGTAVISGALIVGDSVKYSLRQMTLDRLGKIDFVLSSFRFVREKLSDEMTGSTKKDQKTTDHAIGQISPAIIMRAGLQARTGTTSRRAGNVNVYGFDDRVWASIDHASIERPTETRVVLNSLAAQAVGAKVGDEITLWIELPSAVPRDTLMGNKDNDSQEITLTVASIAPEENGLSKLGLQPTQAMPLNVFMDLHFLQERLGLDEIKPSRRDPMGQSARVNALINFSDDRLGAPPQPQSDRLRQVLTSHWTLGDLHLRLVDNPLSNAIVLESDQMILEDKFVTATHEAAQELGLTESPVMVYLANKLWNPAIYKKGQRTGYSMYSTVAGLDIPDLSGTVFDGFEFVGERPKTWGDHDVIINEFLATDLQVKVGDEIKFSYHVMGSRGELPELEQSVTVRGIVKMSGAAIDRTLTPHVKGITDVESLADWDQPFPMDLDAVTPRDDEYWDSYRAVPKMFLPMKTAQRLWPSRYGSLTSIRLARAGKSNDQKSIETLRDEFSRKLLEHLSPAEIGLAFQPVKAMGLAAAGGSTDFSQLFASFSIFLIIAAMILITLLFRLAVEQRVRDLGLLGAVGFSVKQVQKQMLSEGFLISVVGSLIGTVMAVGYAHLMIYGLTHWWVGAVGTKNLLLSVQPLTLLIGFIIALACAIASIWWGLGQTKKLSIREQLQGVTQKEVDLATLQTRRTRVLRRGIACTVLAVLLLGITATGLVPATVIFFLVGILLLTAALSLLSYLLNGNTGTSVQGRGIGALSRLGLKNASRQGQRTVMTAGMIAAATFLIVAVGAFRRDPTSDLPVKSSGNGGFTLVAESSSPVLYDLNTEGGRKKLQLTASDGSSAAKALAEMKVVPFRVRPGEDASCLNLYQTKVPTILGVPRSLINEGRFSFFSGSWKELATPEEASGNTTATAGNSKATGREPIPVLGDMNTLMFSLHKNVGDKVAVPNEDHPEHQLVVKGMFQDSIFQGVLVMAEDDFLRVFPERKGFQYFLIEVPPELAEPATSLLETELTEYGFDVEPVSERLARFLSVQNTYLSTFQTLGGLGLLLGTFGLATVMLRNVLERQSELALLRAVGFNGGNVAWLVLSENALILLWGLIAGAGSALLATAPSLVSRGADVPWESLTKLLAIVFATGMLAAVFAMRSAVSLPIVKTLRGD